MKWTNTTDPTLLYVLKKEEAIDPLPTVVTPIKQTTSIDNIISLDKRGLTDFGLKLALGEKTSVPNTLFTTPNRY